MSARSAASEGAEGARSPEAANARREQLAANLAAVRARIDRACTAAGRRPASITLVAVSKTWPASDVRLLVELGVIDMGENRDAEAAAKAAELADLSDFRGGTAAGTGTGPSAPRLRWHFVGQLQRNKARSVARYAAFVHSVDRPPLVTALSAGAVRAERELVALVQVRLDQTSGRGGAGPADVPSLADAIAAADGLHLGGVMAVAPLGEDPVPAFARLAAVAADLRRAHPDAWMVSAGMSDDLEAAVASGATHVRVGTALFGGRPYPLH